LGVERKLLKTRRNGQGGGLKLGKVKSKKKNRV